MRTMKLIIAMVIKMKRFRLVTSLTVRERVHDALSEPLVFLGGVGINSSPFELSLLELSSSG